MYIRFVDLACFLQRYSRGGTPYSTKCGHHIMNNGTRSQSNAHMPYEQKEAGTTIKQTTGAHHSIMWLQLAQDLAFLDENP